jgi:hypothetical protein
LFGPAVNHSIPLNPDLWGDEEKVTELENTNSGKTIHEGRG